MQELDKILFKDKINAFVFDLVDCQKFYVYEATKITRQFFKYHYSFWPFIHDSCKLLMAEDYILLA